MLFRMMDLYIETLTGTLFELRVSPYETVLSVKARIQRVEGIPINQQHLIWQDSELKDDSCLRDSDVPPEATLRLVLGMRGGPINTRRMAVLGAISPLSSAPSTPGAVGGCSEEEPRMTSRGESPAFSRSDSSRGQTSRQHRPFPRQPVTLLVFRDGDRLNFFRVVDKGDGTLTPMAESLSASPMGLYPDDESGSESGLDRVEEARQTDLDNEELVEKLRGLQRRMNQLRIKRGRKPLEVKGKLSPLPGTSSHLPSDPLLPHPPMLPPLGGCHANETSDPQSTNHEPPSLSSRILQSTQTRPPHWSSGGLLAAHRRQQSLLHNGLGVSYTEGRRQPLQPTTPIRLTQRPTELDTTRFELSSRGSRLPQPPPSGRRVSDSLPPLLQPCKVPSGPLSSRPKTREARKLATETAKARRRCSLCNRKTGLANTYGCRCGSNFCAKHRYSEVHHCPYDYKAEGRRLINETNPVVTAPKLPKI